MRKASSVAEIIYYMYMYVCVSTVPAIYVCMYICICMCIRHIFNLHVRLFVVLTVGIL